MSALIVDEALLREPRLLVPAQAPLGMVRIAPEIAGQVMFCMVGNRTADIKRQRALPTQADPVVIRRFGPALKMLDGSLAVEHKYILSTDASSIIPAGKYVTILACKNKISDTAGGSSFLAISELFNNTAACNLYAPFGDGTLYWRWAGEASGTTSLNVASAPNGEDVVAVTCGDRGMEAWVNGVKIGSNAATPSRAASTNAVWLGRHGAAGIAYSTFHCSLLMIFNTQLPEGLLKSLGSDPYQLLIPA